MNNFLKNKIINKLNAAIVGLFIITGSFGFAGTAYAAYYQCGGNTNGDVPINTSIDFGCTHQGNPIADLLFSIIRLLSAGVGIVVVGSVILAGIQFSASQGDPQGTANAINRIRASLIALLIYIFAYAILNWLIPGGFFNS